jgi:hypothetical protein
MRLAAGAPEHESRSAHAGRPALAGDREVMPATGALEAAGVGLPEIGAAEPAEDIVGSGAGSFELGLAAQAARKAAIARTVFMVLVSL